MCKTKCSYTWNGFKGDKMLIWCIFESSLMTIADTEQPAVVRERMRGEWFRLDQRRQLINKPSFLTTG